MQQTVHIGFTNRDFKTRFNEHDTGHYQKPSSIVALHLKTNKTHSINFPQSLQVLKRMNSKNLAIAHESYEIFKHIDIHGPDSLMNKKEDVKNSILFKFARQLETSSRPPKQNNAATPGFSQSQDNNPSPPAGPSSASLRHAASHVLINQCVTMFRRRPPETTTAIRKTVRVNSVILTV